MSLAPFFEFSTENTEIVWKPLINMQHMHLYLSYPVGQLVNTNIKEIIVYVLVSIKTVSEIFFNF